jgi:hypothetical protein
MTGACKFLFCKRFLRFELECSNRIKPVGVNHLAWVAAKCNSFVSGWLFGRGFDTISTVSPGAIFAGDGRITR